jgi:hypothetical protein
MDKQKASIRNNFEQLIDSAREAIRQEKYASACGIFLSLCEESLYLGLNMTETDYILLRQETNELIMKYIGKYEFQIGG